MFYSRYETFMRWLYGYLAYWEMVAAVAWLVLEGLKVNNVLWSSRANDTNTSVCKLFLGRKWLLRLIYWLGIKIPERYWGWTRHIPKIYGVLCLILYDLAFGEFLELKFPTFSVEGIETKYFEKLIYYLIEFYSSNGFAYLSIFIEIWYCCF